MIKHLLTICFLFTCFNASAQAAKDTTGMSPLKGMGYEQYKAYVSGTDINNMALVAQANYYPDPQKVIVLKKELGLTPAQATQIGGINTELQRKMKEMGAFIIKNEKMLDEMFRTKKVDDGSLIFYVNRYGLYQGEMRNALLQAYVKVQAILTPAQTAQYEQLQKTGH